LVARSPPSVKRLQRIKAAADKADEGADKSTCCIAPSRSCGAFKLRVDPAAERPEVNGLVQFGKRIALQAARSQLLIVGVKFPS
jgi:hypothetical protein